MRPTTWKDYSLKGTAEGASVITDDAIEDRVEREWFSCKIDRKKLKELVRRSDIPALWHFGLWLALLGVSGVTVFFAWGTLWAIPTFAVYGVLYSAGDHRHHELSHGTPFNTRWINEMFFHMCAFMTLREGFYYRWSHSRHHTHTIIVGRDPEIAAPRPPDLLGFASDMFFIRDGLTQLSRIFRNASGDLTEAGKHFVPESERHKVVRASRIYIAIFAGVIVAASRPGASCRRCSSCCRASTPGHSPSSSISRSTPGSTRTFTTTG